MGAAASLSFTSSLMPSESSSEREKSSLSLSSRILFSLAGRRWRGSSTILYVWP
jgi:hypothetical protein